MRGWKGRRSYRRAEPAGLRGNFRVAGARPGAAPAAAAISAAVGRRERRSLPGYGWWGAAGAAPGRVTRRAEPGGSRRRRNPAGGPQRTAADHGTVTLMFAWFRNPF